MNGKNLAAGIFDHLCICQRLFLFRKNANLTPDGNFKMHVKGRDETPNEVPFILKVRTVVTTLCNMLRYGITDAKLVSASMQGKKDDDKNR